MASSIFLFGRLSFNLMYVAACYPVGTATFFISSSHLILLSDLHCFLSYSNATNLVQASCLQSCYKILACCTSLYVLTFFLFQKRHCKCHSKSDDRKTSIYSVVLWSCERAHAQEQHISNRPVFLFPLSAHMHTGGSLLHSNPNGVIIL